MQNPIPQVLFVSVLVILVGIGYVLLWPQEAGRETDIPEFANIQDAKQKKAAFIRYFQPLIEAHNQALQLDREYILHLKAEAALNSSEQAWLLAIASTYRLEHENIFDAGFFGQLLARVSGLPSSLVLAQAATESAWGASRFAIHGHNYFGEWCFSKGCGLVPKKRENGARHEVRSFDSPKASLAAYFLNINRHPSYHQLRQLRAEALESGQALDGCLLALGLGAYSERGMQYVNGLRQLIRSNRLEANTQGSCDDVPLVGATSS